MKLASAVACLTLIFMSGDGLAAEPIKCKKQFPSELRRLQSCSYKTYPLAIPVPVQTVPQGPVQPYT